MYMFADDMPELELTQEQAFRLIDLALAPLSYTREPIERWPCEEPIDLPLDFDLFV